MKFPANEIPPENPHIGPGELRVEVNSERRAKRIRREITQRLSGRAKLAQTEVMTAD